MTYNPRNNAAPFLLTPGAAAEATFSSERILAAGAGLSYTDGGAGGSLTLDWDGLAVSKAGVAVGTRPKLNFIEGSGITLTIADDATNGEIDITVESTASGAPVGATYVTLTTDATLTNERTLAAGDGMTLTDGGAGLAATLAVGAGTGISVAADAVAINQAAALTWTGAHAFNGGLTVEELKYAYTATTANLTLTADHLFVAAGVPATPTANTTITLPSAVGIAGRVYHIKRTDAETAYDVVVDANGTETIDGALTYTLFEQYEAVTVISDGANWLIF